MYLGDIIKRIIEEEGLEYVDRQRTIHTTCPRCGQSDKLSILKDNGATICYRGRCQFKGFFTDWLAETARISYTAAKERIYSQPDHSQQLHGDLEINLDLETTPPSSTDFVPLMCEWPGSFLHIGDEQAHEGLDYLTRRGIDYVVANHYDIRYSEKMRRIMIPIFMDGICYGWQGRAIDNVDDGDRIRNNVGFSRGSLLMFADELKNRSYAIIAEGPFDAMKFYKVGGAVATMGKVVTRNQLQILQKYGVKHFYLALDDDAADEMRDLAQKLGPNSYRITVPESCIQRCQASNRKADFGECTLDECVEAVKNAQKIDDKNLMIYCDTVEDVLRALHTRKDKNEK